MMSPSTSITAGAASAPIAKPAAQQLEVAASNEKRRQENKYDDYHRSNDDMIMLNPPHCQQQQKQHQQQQKQNQDLDLMQDSIRHHDLGFCFAGHDNVGGRHLGLSYEYQCNHDQHALECQSYKSNNNSKTSIHQQASGWLDSNKAHSQSSAPSSLAFVSSSAVTGTNISPEPDTMTNRNGSTAKRARLGHSMAYNSWVQQQQSASHPQLPYSCPLDDVVMDFPTITPTSSMASTSSEPPVSSSPSSSSPSHVVAAIACNNINTTTGFASTSDVVTTAAFASSCRGGRGGGAAARLRHRGEDRFSRQPRQRQRPHRRVSYDPITNNGRSHDSWIRGCIPWDDNIDSNNANPSLVVHLGEEADEDEDRKPPSSKPATTTATSYRRVSYSGESLALEHGHDPSRDWTMASSLVTTGTAHAAKPPPLVSNEDADAASHWRHATGHASLPCASRSSPSLASLSSLSSSTPHSSSAPSCGAAAPSTTNLLHNPSNDDEVQILGVIQPSRVRETHRRPRSMLPPKNPPARLKRGDDDDDKDDTDDNDQIVCHEENVSELDLLSGDMSFRDLDAIEHRHFLDSIHINPVSSPLTITAPNTDSAAVAAIQDASNGHWLFPCPPYHPKHTAPMRVTATRACNLVHTLCHAFSTLPITDNLMAMLSTTNLVLCWERMLIVQDQFRAMGRSTHVDIGYCCVNSDDLSTIRSQGLPLLLGQNQPGGGVADIPNAFARDRIAKVGLLVACLKGQVCAENEHHHDKTNPCPANSVTWHRRGGWKETIFQTSSSQCLAIADFSIDMLQDQVLIECHRRFQVVLDHFVNGGIPTIVDVPPVDIAVLPPVTATEWDPLYPFDDASDLGRASRKFSHGSDVITTHPAAAAAAGHPPSILPPLPPNKCIEYVAPENFNLGHAYFLTRILHGTNAQDECAICLSQLRCSGQKIVRLKSCRHLFHMSCIEAVFNYAETNGDQPTAKRTQQLCPICRTPVVVGCNQPICRGTMPSGTMHISYEVTRTTVTTRTIFNEDKDEVISSQIVIWYRIPAGIQKAYHPKPLEKHKAVNRRIMLPNNADGQNLLLRLEYAFAHGITFQVVPDNDDNDDDDDDDRRIRRQRQHQTDTSFSRVAMIIPHPKIRGTDGGYCRLHYDPPERKRGRGEGGNCGGACSFDSVLLRRCHNMLNARNVPSANALRQHEASPSK